MMISIGHFSFYIMPVVLSLLFLTIVICLLARRKATSIIPVHFAAPSRDIGDLIDEVKDLWQRHPNFVTIRITEYSTVRFYGDIVVDGVPVRELPNYRLDGTSKHAKDFTILLKHGHIEVDQVGGGTIEITPRFNLGKTGILTCPDNSSVEISDTGTVTVTSSGSFEAVDLGTICFKNSGEFKVTGCKAVFCTDDAEVIARQCKFVSLTGTAKGLLLCCTAALVRDAVVLAENCTTVSAHGRCVIKTRNCAKVIKTGPKVILEKL